MSQEKRRPLPTGSANKHSDPEAGASKRLRLGSPESRQLETECQDASAPDNAPEATEVSSGGDPSASTKKYICARCTEGEPIAHSHCKDMVKHATDAHKTGEVKQKHPVLLCPLCTNNRGIRKDKLESHIRSKHEPVPMSGPVATATSSREPVAHREPYTCVRCEAGVNGVSYDHIDDIMVHAKKVHKVDKSQLTTSVHPNEKHALSLCPLCSDDKPYRSDHLRDHIQRAHYRYSNTASGPAEGPASMPSLARHGDRHSATRKSLTTPYLSCTHAKSVHHHFAISHLWKNPRCREIMGMNW